MKCGWRRDSSAKRIRRVLLDSSVYGAAIEDEARYLVEREDYWDVVYSRALLRISDRLQIFGCPPVEAELREAPEALRRKLLAAYSRAKSLTATRRVLDVAAAYRRVGIFPPDGLIVSFAAVYSLDAVVTVNRRHLRRSETIRRIGNVNRTFRLGPLRILLPSEFFELLR